MQIILDENLPHALKRVIPGHNVTTVQGQGWSGISNGELIKKVDGVFDVFITADKNLRYQQNLSDRKISIIELPTNRLPVLETINAQIIEA
jgi:hypothetical protein